VALEVNLPIPEILWKQGVDMAGQVVNLLTSDTQTQTRRDNNVRHALTAAG